MKQLVNQGISSIEVGPLAVFEEEDEEKGARRGANLHREDNPQLAAKKVFFETITAIKRLTDQVIKGKLYVNVRRLKRLAQKAVLLVQEDESFLLGMTVIKNYDEYTFNHSVNVFIYSIAVGKRMGFSRKTLTELGLTALLHDIGKSKVPKEVLNKPGPLSEEEWELMKKHPLVGVEIVLNLKQLGEVNPKMVFGIFEHHLKNNLSGYPRLFRKKEMTLFGQIIQIADAYDAMTTPRVYKQTSYTPEQALAIMLKDKGIHFDPIILKLFIGLVGIHPIGSLVLLNTNHLGIVYKPHPKWVDRPQVILVAEDDKEYRKREVVDLAETDTEGPFKRSIIRTLDPFKYHIDAAKYFL
jgi:HD-GYP domain-containing protein (c-di-GMP phosphodiesterase class II)